MLVVNPCPTTSYNTDNVLSSTGCGTRAGAQGPGRCGLRLHLPLGNGDSIASSHPFLMAAPSPISANKMLPLHFAPKSVPFMGRNVTRIPSYTKAIQNIFKSYSECLALGLKCQGYVERVKIPAAVKTVFLNYAYCWK